jgi:hypothetical protein
VFFVVLYPTVEPDRVAGIGLTLTRTRFARAGWRLAAGSLVLIGLIGFLPLGRALSLPLENRFRRRPASSHAGDPGGRQPRSGQAQGIWGAALAEGRTRGDRKAAGSSCGRRGLTDDLRERMAATSARHE